MAKENGTLPSNEVIQLESCKEQWVLFYKKIIPNFSTTGIIVLKDNKKVRVDIEVSRIIPPYELDFHSTTKTVTSFGSDATEGIQRADQFFSKLAGESAWHFFGFLKGKKKIPIIIVFYEIFTFAIYSLKTENEDIKKFFPAGLPLHEQLN